MIIIGNTNWSSSSPTFPIVIVHSILIVDGHGDLDGVFDLECLLREVATELVEELLGSANWLSIIADLVDLNLDRICHIIDLGFKGLFLRLLLLFFFHDFEALPLV